MLITTDPTYPLFPIFAFLGFILPLIPLTWHLQAWNSGTCYYMMWASLASLNQFVNSVVWHGNALNPAPIWCDISIRIIMGASVGLPAASLCINRRLYYIASTQAVTVTRSDKSRAVLVDTLICVLFPMIYVALQYIVQGHRFNVYGDIGCYPVLYNTLPTYFISSMWPIVVGLISAVYCGLSLRAFGRRRLQFNQFLSSNKSLTISRYFRLMALSMTEIILTVPLSIFLIWLNAVATPIGPWRGWNDTHFNFSRVEQIPAVIWRNNHLFAVAIQLTRWLTPMCSLVFFAYFGFAEEARRHYRAAYLAVRRFFGFKTPATRSSGFPDTVGKYHAAKPLTWPPTPSSPPDYASSSTPSTLVFSLHDVKYPQSPQPAALGSPTNDLTSERLYELHSRDSAPSDFHSTAQTVTDDESHSLYTSYNHTDRATSTSSTDEWVKYVP